MHSQKTVSRISKFLGKVILGLLVILLSVVALIHLSFIQNRITSEVSNYLSSKIEAKVNIERIYFSIFGKVTIDDFTVWAPEGTKVFSIKKIEVSSSIIDLIRGDFIFEEVGIKEMDGHLIHREEGLNIQYIIDAFLPTEKETTTNSNPFILQFDKVVLENIVFDFTSEVSGLSVSVNLGKFTCQDGEFSSIPTKIKADQVTLQYTVVNTLSTSGPVIHNTNVASENSIFLSPDFGTGIVFDIKDLVLSDNDFFFHKNQVKDTPKFDPSHLSLKKIQIHLTDIVIREDTLAAGLQSLSLQLPGFALTDARADIRLDRNQLNLSELHLTSGTNKFQANLTVPQNFQSVQHADQNPIGIATLGRINPVDFSYFFPDSVINLFSHWGSTEFMLEGNFSSGAGELKSLELKTRSSQFQAGGSVNDIFDLEKISWDSMLVTASIGSDFIRTVESFLENSIIPPGLNFRIKSSGNLKKIFFDGKAFTAWGDVKAIGQVSLQPDNVGIDMMLNGDRVNLGELLNQSWLGPMNFSMGVKGTIGNDQQVEIGGMINTIEILDQSQHNITLESKVRKKDAIVIFSIEDPKYTLKINSEISFAGPLIIESDLEIEHFRLGDLLQRDSSLSISGSMKSKIILDQSSMEGYVEGKHIVIQKQSHEYLIDTLAFHALTSPTKSNIEYFTDQSTGKLVLNFDAKDLPEVINTWSENVASGLANRLNPKGSRTASVNIEMGNANLFQLAGIDVEDFSSLRVSGEFDEQKHRSALNVTSGKFNGYGILLDSMNTTLMVFPDSASASMSVKNLFYNSVPLSNMDIKMRTRGDTLISNLLLSNDSVTLLGFQARILPCNEGAFLYPDSLKVFNNDYLVDPKNPAFLSTKNIVLNHFLITRDDMQINLDGELNAFNVSLRNIDLTGLNHLLSADSTIINTGKLSGNISYSPEQQLNLRANIDNLSLYNSNPLTVAATAVSDGNKVPFEFLLTNESNEIHLKGQYFLASEEVDASLLLDVSNLELFSFLVSDFIEEMSGTIKGEATILGSVEIPEVKGQLQFQNVELTTVNPHVTFSIQDDRILLDNSSMVFNNFKIYDQEKNPLTVNGKVSTNDYKSYSYDIQLVADQFALINKPDSSSSRLRGKLVIDSKIDIKGNEKDTNLDVKLAIKDATKLTFVTSNNEIELLKTEGIIDFVGPELLNDSVSLELSSYFYDSLISSLPDFNVNSTVTIEDNAVIRVLIDEQSGDYIEASGGASLELGYGRTGNVNLSGKYIIRTGAYRLSFYDLVKKNFSLVRGSSINWTGSPENGDLDIKAVHTVPTNSIGLIGHEIGEDEKSIYKRSLNYEVGINIGGSIEKPIVSFSLDLPPAEKADYPVLANKLDRLRQPEYAAELNKQVFGLLVLGGFLPESSVGDVNSSVVAATALSNSVNSLLASQLNRFASQYIKGVNIDVGIQSYSDYSAPGGKTSTAMDFRVSKSIMDERLSFEIGGDFDINQDQSGGNTGTKNYRGDIAIIYDLTGKGDKKLKLFNNETYDIIYQEIRNTGISVVFIREFDSAEKGNKKVSSNK